MAAKKEQILDYLAEGHTWIEAYRKFDTTYAVIRRIRDKDAEWDSALKGITHLKGRVGSRVKGGKFDPDRKIPSKGDFADWRMKYLGRPTNALGAAIADGMLDWTNRIVFILGPPGGGKDTTVGDVLLYQKCDDRDYLRCAWIMENDNFSVRRISERIEPYLTDPQAYRVKPHMTPGGQVPTATLIDDYGPFKWMSGMEYPDGSPVEKTTWTQHELRFLQSASAPEAEPDLWATGVGGALYGARVGEMVFSDLFTKENQRSMPDKESSFQWCIGTADSRLDTMGRLIDLGTRVEADDNHARLMKHYIGDAEVYDVVQEGPLTKTTYTNGVCVIICVAIWHDENGEERSYDEARFPLDGKWQLVDGSRIELSEMSIGEAKVAGAKRVLGLREMRLRDPVWFETAYQQNPSPDGKSFDFTDAILDLCSDTRRSYGKALPSEIKIIVVDPARAGGAAWGCLGVDLESQEITLIDYRLYSGLGIIGIKQKLIIEPLTLWQPRYLSYEINHEYGVLFDRDIQNAIRDFGVTLKEHSTHKNRFDRTIGVGSVAQEMRDRRLNFPCATVHDQARTLVVRQHFKNWDAAPKSVRSTNMRTGHPDDLAMAIWPGVLLARQLFDQHAGALDRKESRPVPEFIKRRWKKKAKPEANNRRPALVGVDFASIYVGNLDDQPH